MASEPLEEWTDLQLDHVGELFARVAEENEKQLRKWGIQKRTPFEWLAYLGEEVGEVDKAVSEYMYRNGTREEIVKEAIQVATLALKIAEMASGGNDEFGNH